MAAVAAPKPELTRYVNVSVRFPNPRMASSTVPRRAVTPDKNRYTPEYRIPTDAVGVPTRTKLANNARSKNPSELRRHGKVRSPRKPTTANAATATICEISVAQPAPRTSSRGNGPRPKIRKGSSAPFTNTIAPMMNSGVRVFPAARMTDSAFIHVNVSGAAANSKRR